jgi:KaiC/GvpD/RAD55 family RecA-like ATPase
VEHGVILSGPFGTGKTLTAAHTAKASVESGWIYFALKTPKFFVDAYDMAHKLRWFLYLTVLLRELVDEVSINSSRK